jgi:hypothetical protein
VSTRQRRSCGEIEQGWPWCADDGQIALASAVGSPVSVEGGPPIQAVQDMASETSIAKDILRRFVMFFPQDGLLWVVTMERWRMRHRSSWFVLKDLVELHRQQGGVYALVRRSSVTNYRKEL